MRYALGLATLGMVVACGSGEAPSDPAPVSGPGAATQPASEAPAAVAPSPEAWAGPGAPAGDPMNLASVAAGARVVSAVDGTDSVLGAGALLDEWLATNWANAHDGKAPMEAVIELATLSRIERVELHLQGGMHYEELPNAPKEVVVEVGLGATGPWAPLTRWTPTATPSQQLLTLPGPAEARFVRVSIPGNQGGDFSPFLSHLGLIGRPVGPSPEAPKLDGRYHGGWLMGGFELFTDSKGLRGCFIDTGKPIDVTLDGRTAALRWTDEDGSRGVALLVPTPKGELSGMVQVFAADGNADAPTPVGAEVQPDAQASCPREPGKSAIERELEEGGRARVYSLLFDFGSDKLRPESQAVLDEIGEVLGRHPEWKLLIEGHTDAVGSDASNLDLSKRRAAAAVKGLGERGVAAERLRSDGFGEERPVADNASPTGRAQNRRVELVRE